MKLKFCGIRRLCEIETVNELKPEYVGFVFAESRRRIEEREAERLSGKLKKGIVPVGVFVEETPEKIAELWKRGVIQAAQLHGREDGDYIRRLRERFGGLVIKAVPVKGPEDILKAQALPADYLLFDSGRGGTGTVFPWKAIEEAEKRRSLKPFFLAGGICLENIGQARKTGAWGLDVSSGIETDGKKDLEKMKRFAESVREG